jgi:leader peptidase (prepilin peptidase) / N-methyltransferase
MDWTIGIFIFFAGCFGLLIGSFLNVVAIRVLKKESIVFPPSHCVDCNHKLGPLDLVPVLSYLFLCSKCRYCKSPISLIYPAGELATGILFALFTYQLGLQSELIAGLFFVSILVVITITDLREMLIPNRIIFFAMAVGAGLRLFAHTLPIWNYLSAFVVGIGILYLIARISSALLKKEGIGGGDLKLFAFIGLILGIKLTLLAIFISSLLGTIFGLCLIIIGKYDKNRYLPFGPFIAAGSMITYLWGNHLVKWYMELVLI